MDSKIDNPQDPHAAGYSVLEGEDDQQHHEKKSVMTKVKAKAKKMKNSFAKRARGHGGHDDEQNPPNQEDDYQEDDDYDDTDDNVKMVQSPEVHRTPSGEEGITPILKSFGKMSHDDQDPPVDQHINLSTGIRDPELPPFTKTDSEHSPDDSITKESPENQSYLSFATCAITGSVLSAKNVVASKLGYGGKDDNELVSESKESGERETAGTHDQLSPSTKTDLDQPQDDSSTKEFPQNQSGGYTDKLSFATSAITGRALSAKNAVASKLGYGGKEDNPRGGETETLTLTPNSPSSPSQTDGYGKKITSTVTGTLSPVYSKVAAAGTTVMSRVTGTATGGETEDANGKVPDKGVSMKQYLSEKLKPGEDDKALSEVISTSLYKSKEEGADHREGKPMGRVTESEEVVKRLGTGDDYSGGEKMDSGEVKLNSGDTSDVNKGMVNSVSSWFGKGEVGNGIEETDQRKLQESSN